MSCSLSPLQLLLWLDWSSVQLCLRWCLDHLCLHPSVIFGSRMVLCNLAINPDGFVVFCHFTVPSFVDWHISFELPIWGRPASRSLFMILSKHPLCLRPTPLVTTRLKLFHLLAFSVLFPHLSLLWNHLLIWKSKAVLPFLLLLSHRALWHIVSCLILMLSSLVDFCRVSSEILSGVSWVSWAVGCIATEGRFGLRTIKHRREFFYEKSAATCTFSDGCRVFLCRITRVTRPAIGHHCLWWYHFCI